MDGFFKSVETTEEAIAILTQLQHLLSRHGFGQKVDKQHSDEVSEAIPVDFKSIRNTKQIEVGPDLEGS